MSQQLVMIGLLGITAFTWAALSAQRDVDEEWERKHAKHFQRVARAQRYVLEAQNGRGDLAKAEAYLTECKTKADKFYSQ